jgi:hypothetical protein
MKRLCSEWGGNDCIYIFKQTHSFRFEETGTSPVQVKQITIPRGNTEMEIWKAFDIIYGIFQDNDEASVDISSCPKVIGMLVFSLLQYAKFLKNIHVKGIYYGKLVDANTHISKNLTAFSDIQDWALAAGDFISFGNTKRLNKVTEKQLASILKNTNGGCKEISGKLKELNNHIENLSRNISTNQSKSLIEGLDSNRILEIINQLQQHLIEPLNPILVNLKKSVQEIYQGKNEKGNMLGAVQWCIDKQLIQEGLTLLQEGIIAHFLTVHNDKIRRDFSSYYLNQRFKGIVNGEASEGNNSPVEKELKNYFESIENIIEWSHLFAQITEVRNEINHGGMTGNVHVNHFERKLKELYERTKELLYLKSKNRPFYHYFYKECYY